MSRCPIGRRVPRERIYEVFARRGEDPLTHLGSVNALSDELAKDYALSLYSEDASFAEMVVVPRDSVLEVPL